MIIIYLKLNPLNFITCQLLKGYRNYHENAVCTFTPLKKNDWRPLLILYLKYLL